MLCYATLIMFCYVALIMLCYAPLIMICYAALVCFLIRQLFRVSSSVMLFCLFSSDTLFRVFSSASSSGPSLHQKDCSGDSCEHNAEKVDQAGSGTAGGGKLNSG